MNAAGPLAAPPEEFREWRRREFPFFERRISLTHASVTPLPARVRNAIVEYATHGAAEGQFDHLGLKTYRRAKELAAQLIGCIDGGSYDAAIQDKSAGKMASPREIAYASSTSHALGLVATGLPWQRGDNCVVADGDFPANVIVWKNLQQTRGVEVRLLPYRPRREITCADLEPLLDERTRVVSLSTANFLSGYPLDLDSIGRFLHERGIWFGVDAIQTLGAVPLDARQVDFIAADAHKWLLGPNGIALLWVRPALLDQLHPAILGWLAVEGRDDWFAYHDTPATTAERFEPGAWNNLGIVGLDAALCLIHEVGPAAIGERVVRLRDYGARRLKEIGCRLLWEPESSLASGIFSFQPPAGNTPELYKKLDERFALSLRQDRAGSHWLRVSAHFMNMEEDLDELGDTVAGWLKNLPHSA